MKTILSILTFSMIMPSSPSTRCNDAMNSPSALLANNNYKDCEAFQKHHIHQQCNENNALKGMQKDIPLKLCLLHIPKVIPCKPSKTSQNFTSKFFHKRKTSYSKP